MGARLRRQGSARVVAPFVALAIAAACACGCASEREDWRPERNKPSSYYEARCFVWEEGRCRYERGSVSASATGVDVSEYQGDIDWWAAAQDGIDFAFLRLGYRGSTEGLLYADTHFDQNYWAAQDAGVACGAYFYSQATSVDEALEEAAFVLEVLNGRYLAYPVAFDFEPTDGSRIEHVDEQTATACARAFCDAVRDGGYEPMLYGNAYDLALFDLEQLNDVWVWLAQYAEVPTFATRFDVWQYANDGEVAGIGSGVDLNLDLSGAQEQPQ